MARPVLPKGRGAGSGTMTAVSCAEKSQGYPGAALHAPVHAHHQGHRARFSDPRRAAKIDSEETGHTGSRRAAGSREVGAAPMMGHSRSHLLVLGYMPAWTVRSTPDLNIMPPHGA